MKPLCRRSELTSFLKSPSMSCSILFSLPYFFSSLPRLFAPDFAPTSQDIIQTRVRSIGITETTFHLPEHEMLMVDVGGQKSERRKWIHCFQDVTSILFLISLSGYDQCLVEDKDSVSFNFLPHFSFNICGMLSWIESDAGRYDNMGRYLSFTVVQTDVNRMPTPR